MWLDNGRSLVCYWSLTTTVRRLPSSACFGFDENGGSLKLSDEVEMKIASR